MEYEDQDGDEGGNAEDRRRGRYKQDVEREVDRIKVRVSCCNLIAEAEAD
jgi:hypothetical protein